MQIGVIWFNICPNPSIMDMIGIIIMTFHQVVGIQLPWVILSTTSLTNSFIYSITRVTYRRKIFFRKEFWSLPWVHTKRANSVGLNSPKYPKSKIPTPIFKSRDNKKNMLTLKTVWNPWFKVKIFFTQFVNMIEARLSWLKNMHRNEKTLPTQSLTIPDTSNHIDENQESWYLGDYDQDSISSQNFKLEQYQLIDKLASFHF